MPRLYTNFASSVTGQALSASSQLVFVAPGYGSLFPTIAGPTDFFTCTLEDDLGNIEIVLCTARAGDSFVITRAQEGTTALDFPLGSRFETRMTAATPQSFMDPAEGVFLGDANLNGNALINGEIVGVPIRGEAGDTSNELVVPAAGARPTIGGVDIMLVTDNPVSPGSIMLWDDLGNIPLNWFLCDGTNGTPDLRSRFIIGYDATNPAYDTIGNMGGNPTQTELGGAHDHGSDTGDTTLTDDDIPTLTLLTANQVTSNNNSDNHNDINSVAAGTNTNARDSETAVVYENPTPVAHKHTVNPEDAHVHDYLPPFSVLAYIQYKGVVIPPIFTGAIPDALLQDNQVVPSTPGGTFDMSLQFNEGTGTGVTYSAVGLPTGLTIAPATGIVSGTVGATASGGSPYGPVITLTTSDGVADSSGQLPQPVWTVAAGLPSLLVTWVEGAGAPTLNGPEYTSLVADAAVNDLAASTISTIDSDIGLYYAEFDIVTFGTDVTFGFGWKRTAILSDTTSAQMIGVYWDNVLAGFRNQVNTLGNTSQAFDSAPVAPLDGMVFGVAIDCSTNKLYIHIDGVWMTTLVGTEGGDPSGGLGWDIVNPAQTVGLYSYSQSDNCTLKARQPQYTPAGYTPVT